MTSRKDFPTESHLSRDDIELLARLEGGQTTLIEQVNSLQTNVRNHFEELRRDHRKQQEAMRKEHNEQMELLNTRVTDLEAWRATNLTATDINRWNKVSNWAERYQDRMALLMTIGGVIITILSGIIVWFMNAFVLPIVGGK